MRIRRRIRLTILLISSLCLPLNDLVDASSSIHDVQRRGNLSEQLHTAQHRTTQATATAACIGTSLYPSQILDANEFLCRNSLRFGIDNEGILILGISTDEAVTPTSILWEAASTSLFVSASPFTSLELSSDGNLLGYADGSIIYDSNLDYANRMEGKAADSVLSLSADCSEGEMCVKLISPAVPGMPYGDVTWGIVNKGDSVVSVELDSSVPDFLLLQQTNAPSSKPITSQPTEYPSRPPPSTEVPTTISPSFEPTLSPEAKPLTALIWGSLWMDSDSNGVTDVGEAPLGGVTVHLYECSNSSTIVETKITDSKGWYFFQVEDGTSYKVHFDVDPLYEFTSGVDTDSTAEGWTDCQSPTTENPIQWNAGLHNPSSDVPFAEKPTPSNSKIGGAIFIDLNGDGSMDSVEDNAVEKGYTVGDAVVHVSIHDCEANTVMHSQDVEFPGKYLFEDLTEGLYKVEFDIVLTSNGKQNKDSKLPLYSFYDEEDGNTSSFETNCINLRRNAADLSVHAGIRIPKLKVNTKVSEKDIKDMMATSAEAEVIQNAVLSAEETPKGGEKKTSVAGIVVGVLAALGVVVGSALFLYKKRQLANSDASAMSSVCVSLKEAAMDSLIVEFGGPADFTKEKDSSGTSDDDDKSEGSQGDDDDALNTTTDRRDADMELDEQFQQNPYHQNASSIFESESLDSDPYIYTGDEHSDGSSSPYIFPADEQDNGDTNPYIYTGDAHTDYSTRTERRYETGIMQSQQAGSHALSWAQGNPSHYYGDESSVVSNRSADPPAASYRDIPAPSYDYQAGDPMAAIKDCYDYSSNDDGSLNIHEVSQTAAEDFYHHPSNNVGSSDMYQTNEHMDANRSHYRSSDNMVAAEDLGASLDSYDLSYDESEESSSSRSSSSSISNSYDDNNRSKSAPSGRPHAGWTQDSIKPEYESNNYPVSQARRRSVDEQSVISSQSDHSADPPGASYQNLGINSYHSRQCRTRGRSFTPPAPRQMFPPPPPPRR